jgi:NAD+ kinase
MQRIGLVLKRSDRQAELLGETMNRFLKECGKEVLLESAREELAAAWKARVSEQLTDEADLLVVLGGDGTILRAAALLNDKPTPVLGINLGRVGFMAEVSPEEAISELKAAIEGTAAFAERMLLQVTLPDGKTARVLNDLVIHWASIARLIDLGLKIGASNELEVRADGLIVSTPVGSSAYSYAASGPLVHPEVHAILMTPICPYAGLKRPVLIPPHMETQIVLKRGEEFRLTLDGHTTVPLEQGQSISVVRSPVPFIMVKTKFRDYFDVLKEKLGII